MKKLAKEKENGLKLKTRKTLIFSTILFSIFVLCSFSKHPIDFTNYEEFVESFYVGNKNDSFEKIRKYLYSNRSCVRILITYYNEDDTVRTEQMMVSEVFDAKEIESVDKFLSLLSNFQKQILTSESVENIYDVPVPDLFCLNYKVKYENLNTYEQFWLKERDGKIFIYRYTICLDVYE